MGAGRGRPPQQTSLTIKESGHSHLGHLQRGRGRQAPQQLRVCAERMGLCLPALWASWDPAARQYWEIPRSHNQLCRHEPARPPEKLLRGGGLGPRETLRVQDRRGQT